MRIFMGLAAGAEAFFDCVLADVFDMDAVPSCFPGSGFV
jgi:hypothetical protein